jgi:hypothetical protein
MEVMKKLNNSYDNISSLLQSCKCKLQELKEQRFDTSKGKTVKDAIMKETNKELRMALTNFFDAYKEVESALNETDSISARIDSLPMQGSLRGEETPDEETQALRRIEKILERQDFNRKLDRLSDEEVISLYQKTAEKADRLRKSLVEKINAGEFCTEEAQRVLRTDANVRLAAMLEDQEYPLIGKKPLRETLNRIVSAARTRRISDNPNLDLRRKSEMLHSSICFLLRDMSENNLSIKDWEKSENIVDGPDDKQVEFFLAQSEKYLALKTADDDKNASADDILSI